MKNKSFLYHYKALITAAYDGDTVTADIDLGLKTEVKGEKLRLNGGFMRRRCTERNAWRAGGRPQCADRDV